MTEELNGGCLDEREAFEAWAELNGWNRTHLSRSRVNNTYAWRGLNEAWDAFQAGRASLSTSKQAGAEPVDERALRTLADRWEERAVEETATRRVDGHCMAAALRSCAMGLRIALSTPGAAIAAREQEAPSDDEQLVATLIHCSREVSPTAMIGYDLASVLIRAAERIQSIATPPAAIPATPSEALIDKLVEDFKTAARSHPTATNGYNLKIWDNLRSQLRAALTQPTTVQQALSDEDLIQSVYEKTRSFASINILRAAYDVGIKTAQTTALPGDKEAA